MSNNSLLIDASLCTGCKSCQSACKVVNHLGFLIDDAPVKDYSCPTKMSSETWTYIESDETEHFVKRMCFHCTDAECIKSCPERAIYRYSGWVVVDRGKCIGCRTCEGKCPYGAIHVGGNNSYKTRKGKAQKCDGCFSAGMEIPACFTACPSGALSYGNHLKILKEAEKRIAFLNRGFVKYVISGIKQNGGMNVFTIDTKEIGKSPASSDRYDQTVSKFFYALFAPFSMGFPVLKRKIWDLSRALSFDKDDENNKKKV
jgi:Fe-S-cluster-containing dehydrogenase component